MTSWTQVSRHKSAKIFLLLSVLLWLIGGILLYCFSDEEIYKSIMIHNHPILDNWIPFITMLGEGWLITIVLLSVFFTIPSIRNKRFFLFLLCSNIGTTLIAQIVKRAINAPRPLALYKDSEWVHIVAGQPLQYHFSFPSGHTIGAFTFFFVLSLLLPHRWAWLSVVFFTLAMLVAFSRIYLSQHFFVDVYVGSIIGVSCSLLIYNFMRPREV